MSQLPNSSTCRPPLSSPLSFVGMFSAVLAAGLLVAATLALPGPGLTRLSGWTAPDDRERALATDQQDGWPSGDAESLPPAEDLIKDWEKPDVALFVTGRQHGYIEPCGCTGLANQKGGLMRRHSVMKLLRGRGWDLIPVDAGNQIRRFGQQPVIKLQKTYDALCKTMGYEHVAFGPDDLKLGTIDLIQVMLNAQDDTNPFTCANLTVMGDDSMTNRFRVVEKNGIRIGVTAILGEEYIEKLAQNDELKAIPPAEALAQLVPAMKQQCDFLILTAQTSMENCRALANQFPVFNLLVTTGGAGDPTLHPEEIVTGDHVTPMIQVGVKGMYVGIVGIYKQDGALEIRYERVPLDARFADSPEMIEIFKSYQAELKSLYTQGALEDIRPRPHPSGASFVGSEACADCHFDEYEIWEEGTDGEGGPHHHATVSLIDPKERGFVARNFDPECLSCHVTGWHPQNYYPYTTGYLDVDKDKHLFGNGCENCHGPGSAHIAAEEADDDKALMEKWRASMRLTIEEAKKQHCMSCHDLDNSPDFLKDGAWEEYWPRIEH